MCGILFTRVSEEAIEQFNRLQHRGPDNSSHLAVNGFFLGTHRLSIINPTPSGNQPLERNGVYLICNGQIYNYVALSLSLGVPTESLRSDVDIILHLYEALDHDMVRLVNLLDGDFAFVLYDSSENVVHVARDGVGVRPLFYSMKNGELFEVASELKGLASTSTPAVTDVFKPGTLLAYNVNAQTTYSCDFATEFQEQRIVDLLRRAVIKRIDNSDRPVAFLCSGGLDSSVILCLAHEYLKTQPTRDIHVFSMKYTGSASERRPPMSEDEFFCKRLVELLGVKYTSLSFSFEEVKECIEKVVYQTETYDPNTIRTSIANYLLAKKIRETTDYKVFLSGEGADELFCGYLYFNQLKSTMDNVDSEINRESARLIENIHMFDVLKADRCFNAFGLEVRVPFLDKEFIAYVKSIDGRHKGFVDNTEKHLLRSAFKHAFPVLSEARIIDRRKERFSDGVSFSYVPDLLNFCCDGKETRLDKKEEQEKQFYRAIFDRHYAGLSHVIAQRSMPAWCTNLSQIVSVS